MRLGARREPASERHWVHNDDYWGGPYIPAPPGYCGAGQVARSDKPPARGQPDPGPNETEFPRLPPRRPFGPDLMAHGDDTEQHFDGVTAGLCRARRRKGAHAEHPGGAFVKRTYDEPLEQYSRYSPLPSVQLARMIAAAQAGQRIALHPTGRQTACLPTYLPQPR